MLRYPYTGTIQRARRISTAPAAVATITGKEGLPKDTLLNVNVPNLPIVAMGGVRITCLGKRIFDSNTIIKKTDPRGKEYYWIGGSRVNWEPRKDTDQEAVEQGLVSVTPIHLDLTNYSALGHLRSWENLLTRRRR